MDLTQLLPFCKVQSFYANTCQTEPLTGAQALVGDRCATPTQDVVTHCPGRVAKCQFTVTGSTTAVYILK